MKSIITLLSLGGLILSGNFTLSHGQDFLTNGLVAYYPFNGNLNDEAGTNNGTAYGATLTSDRFGNGNSAFYFNGTSDYIRVTNEIAPVGRSEFTLTTWLLMSADTFNLEHRFFVTADGLEQWQMFLGRNGNSYEFDFYTGAIDVGGPVLNWQPSKWFQMAVVRSKGTGNTDNVSWFYNGKFITNAPVSAGNDSSSALTFGKRLDDDSQGTWSGNIDDIRLYNRALSSDEVQQLYQIEAPVTLSIGIAAWNISWLAKSNITYQIQWSTDLNTWSNLVSVVGTGATTNVVDPNYGGNRFYRAIAQP